MSFLPILEKQYNDVYAYTHNILHVLIYTTDMIIIITNTLYTSMIHDIFK